MSERRESTDPSRWLEYARDDLRVAHLALQHGYFSQAAYMAQQAGEKALKALILDSEAIPARTHDLFALRRVVPAERRAALDEIDLKPLNEWGVAERYPSDSPEVSESAARTCVADADAVLAAVEDEFAEGAS
jgi:HEPN domain-containing protein